MTPAPRSTEAAIRRFRTGLLLAAWGLLCAQVHASPETRPRRELVGLVVHQREVGTLEVARRDDEFLLPLDTLGELLGLTRSIDGGAVTLATPLGPVRLAPEDLVRLDGELYVPERTLRSRLATEVAFDSSEFALALDVPWDRGPGGGPMDRSAPLEPEIRAPSSSLSTLSGELTHTRYGDSTNLYGHLRMQGRLQQGLWSVRLQDSEAGPFRASEYHWFTRHGHQTHLLGRQNLQLHPGLGGFDLVGYQFSWNDGRAAGTAVGDGNHLLVPRHTRPRESFSGAAEPGSYVQLRVDGRVVDARQVGFDGTFEFYDVPLPSRQMSQIELLVYDRHNRQIPVETRRFRLAASELLLPAGTRSHTGGVGATGLFSESWIGTAPGTPHSPGGYYQWRQGLTGAITAEAAVQVAGGEAQAHAGFVARLADAWVMNVGLTRGSGATGYHAALETYKTNWRLFLRTEAVPGSFSLFGDGLDRSHHALEYYRDIGTTMTVGVIARGYDDGQRRASYVLPSLTWRPTSRFFIDARPDFYGRALGHFWWGISDTTQLRLFTAGSSELELSHELNERYETDWNTGFGGGLPLRHQLSVTRRPQTLRGWGMQAGVVQTDSRWGYMLAANTPVLPGVQARVEYQSIPHRSLEGDRQPGRLLVTVSTDLSQVGGRMVPAQTIGGYRDRGAIAGRIRVDPGGWSGTAGGGRALAGIAVLVDDRVRGRTDVAGRFFLDNLEPGIHVVELDPEHLPIELNPVRSRFVVEVVRGSATSLDFAVVPEFGIAGRITDIIGGALGGVRLELVDGAGSTVGFATSDRFGLYRMDGIPAGDYLLRVLDPGAKDRRELGRRPVRIVDDFLFGQDLAVGMHAEELARRVESATADALR